MTPVASPLCRLQNRVARHEHGNEDMVQLSKKIVRAYIGQRFAVAQH